VENARPGSGVRGPGAQGPGVWKTPGLVENAGSNLEKTGYHYFSPKYELSSLSDRVKILLAKLR